MKHEHVTRFEGDFIEVYLEAARSDAAEFEEMVVAILGSEHDGMSIEDLKRVRAGLTEVIGDLEAEQAKRAAQATEVEP